MNTLRLGFVGVGTMGQMAHLRNYATSDGCEIVALAELREKTGRAVARRYGIESHYRTAREMLRSERLDAIVASQPFTRHGQILPELLAAGKPIFIEKPLASSVTVGRRLVRAVEESGTFVMLGYHKRSDPATEYVRAAVDTLNATGDLGRMTYVRILMPAGDWIAHGFDGLVVEDDAPPALDLDESPEGVSAKRQADYVTFVNYYIHQVNLLRFLLGESYRTVFADRGGRLLVAESASGITGAIEMSPYRTSIAWQEEVLLCYEHGWVKLALPAPLAMNRPGTVTIYADRAIGGTAATGGGPASATGAVAAGGRSAATDEISRLVGAAVAAGRPLEFSPTLPWIHAMKNQAANFLAAARGERPPVTGAPEALEDLVVAAQYLDLLDTTRK